MKLIAMAQWVCAINFPVHQSMPHLHIYIFSEGICHKISNRISSTWTWRMCVFVLVGQVVGSQWEGLDCLCSPSTAQEEGWKEGEVGAGGGRERMKSRGKGKDNYI